MARTRPSDSVVAGDDIRAQYERDGVVLMRQMLTTAEVDQIRDVFTAKVEADQTLGFDDGVPTTDILRRYPRFVHPHRHRDTEAGELAWRYLLDRRIFDVVETLIGPAWGAQSMFYFKPPGARGQALHQDETSLRTHPETCIAAWVAIDSCDTSNGSLSVVPGSHREDLLCVSAADADDSFTGKGIQLPEEAVQVHTEMAAGDVLFFHGHLVHGSHRNVTTDRFRRSLIFHYVPQSSQRIANFYDPLVDPAGNLVSIDPSPNGGPCGWDWEHIESPEAAD